MSIVQQATSSVWKTTSECVGTLTEVDNNRSRDSLPTSDSHKLQDESSAIQDATSATEVIPSRKIDIPPRKIDISTRTITKISQRSSRST